MATSVAAPSLREVRGKVVPLDPATLEAAAQRPEMSNATIRLHAAELTAGEMRAVQAVLAWKARELRALARSVQPGTPSDG